MNSHTNKAKVIIPIGCRSDEVLSAPIIKRLQATNEFDVRTVQLPAPIFSKSYALMESVNELHHPDLVLLVGDRIEMFAAAAACFHNNIKTGHVYAGVINSISTLDDVNRHAITLWSNIQFCESCQAAKTVRGLSSSVGIPSDAYVVGITHFDDVNIENIHKSKLYSDYDLVLYNPVTLGNLTKELESDVEEIVKSVSRSVILISPNPDPGSNVATALICDTLQSNGVEVVVNTQLPHDKFLMLIKGCHKFITNSSAAIYEAPVLLEPEQIVHIGNRNWARSTGPFETGASDKIVEILKAKLLDEAKP